LTVLPNGQLRVVWDNDEAGATSRHVYGATITPPNICVPRQFVLDATLFYDPPKSVNALIKPLPPLQFALPGSLPVVFGNADSGYALLAFKLGSQLPVLCLYHGANLGKQYDFVTSTMPGLGPGGLITADAVMMQILSGKRTGFSKTEVRVVLTETPCRQ
jgi:hypothetical protein